MPFRKRSLIPAALIVAGAVLAGCDNYHRDKISDILNNPNRFARHDVTVAGEVTDVKELPLGIANLAAYRVNDGTGQLWVISHAGAPVVGDKVGLKGSVDQNKQMSFLGTSLLTVLDDHERRIR